jgi:peptide/nickel transport system ATP-binding protein
MRKVRGAGIAMIFQEPMTALNPLRTIGDQIGEMFEIHTELSKAEIEARVLALLEDVRIPDPAGWRAPIRTSSPAASASAR